MAHLEALATNARPAGSDAAATARTYCADHLRSLGFVVTERPFEFSALPGKHAAQILGVVGGAGVVGTAAHALMGKPGLAAAGAAAVAIVMTLLAWLGGRGATRGRFLRQAAVNLEAVRGVDPLVWLVAHIDSKSQPISTAVRTIGVILLGTGLVGVVGIAFGLHSTWATWVIGGSGFVGGVLLSFAGVTARSSGAVDNASGVVAVLDAVGQIDSRRPVGVLITDAEELALAGSRAWVIGRQAGIAINCDTIDDDGRFVVMRYGGGELAELAIKLARTEDPRAVLIRPLPGVLTDSVAFRGAGWQTVTLSRGTIRTLDRIHTERDTLSSMRGTGIPAAARVLARIVEELV